MSLLIALSSPEPSRVNVSFLEIVAGSAPPGGITGTGATSQAQTASGTAQLGHQGTGSTAQAQTSAGAGQLGHSGTGSTSQAQTASGAGQLGHNATGATSQAQTAAGTGVVTTAGAITGTGATSQAQTSAGAGVVVSGVVVFEGGGRFISHWQPYWLDKREWEKKIPQKAVQAIERIAQSEKRGEVAEQALRDEISDFQTRYLDMLRGMQAMQVNTLQALRLMQMREIARIEQEIEDENNEFLLLM